MDLIGAYAIVFLQIILNTLWQGMIVGGGVWVLVHMLPKTSAATRHAVLFIGLFTIGALPFISLVTSLNSKNKSIEEQQHSYVQGVQGSESNSLSTGNTVISGKPGDPYAAFDDDSPISKKELILLVSKRAPELLAKTKKTDTAVTTDTTDTNAASISGATQGTDNLSDKKSYQFYSIIFLAIWGVIFILMMMRTIRSYIAVRSLCSRGCYALDVHQEIVDRLSKSMNIRRRVKVMIFERISMPMTVGTLIPVILVPPCIFELLTREELESVMMHELAHIKRLDYLFNFIHRIIQAYLFFHPAVYLLGKQLSVEREHACDDWAVKVCEPRRYAGSLARLIEFMNESKWVARASVGSTSLMMMLGKHVITRRVEMILDHKRNSTVNVSRSAVISACGAAALAISLCIMFSPVVALPNFSASCQENDQITDKKKKGRPKPSPAPKAPLVPNTQSAPKSLLTCTDHPPAPTVAPLPPPAPLSIKEGVAPLRSIELELSSLVPNVQPLTRVVFQDPKPLVFPVPLRVTPLNMLDDDLDIDVEIFEFQDKDGKAKTPAISDKDLLNILTEIAKKDSDDSVRKEAMSAICRLQGEDSVDSIVDIYDSLPDSNMKLTAIRTLSRSNNKKAVDKLVSIAKNDSDPKLRLAAVRYLSGHRGQNRNFVFNLNKNVSQWNNKNFQGNIEKWTENSKKWAEDWKMKSEDLKKMNEDLKKMQEDIHKDIQYKIQKNVEEKVKERVEKKIKEKKIDERIEKKIDEQMKKNR